MAKNKYQDIIDKKYEGKDTDELLKEKDYDSIEYIVNAYYFLNLYDESLNLADRALEDEREVRFQLMKHHILFAIGEEDKAEEILKSTLEKSNYDSLSLTNRIDYITLLILDSQHEEAIVKCKELFYYAYKALKIFPEGSPALIDLGYAYMLNDEFEVSKVAFENAINANPYSGDALMGLALTLGSMEDIEAKDYFKKYQEMRPKNFPGWEYAYKYYKNIDDKKEIRDSLKHMTALKPESAEYVKELLQIYLDEGDNEAFEELGNAFAEATTKLEGDALIAKLKSKNGLNEESYNLYKNIIENYASKEINYSDIYDGCQGFMKKGILIYMTILY